MTLTQLIPTMHAADETATVITPAQVCDVRNDSCSAPGGARAEPPAFRQEAGANVLHQGKVTVCWWTELFVAASADSGTVSVHMPAVAVSSCLSPVHQPAAVLPALQRQAGT